jgi:hypothetical protein
MFSLDRFLYLRVICEDLRPMFYLSLWSVD